MLLNFTFLLTAFATTIASALTINLRREYRKFKKDARNLVALITEAKLDLDYQQEVIRKTPENDQKETEEYDPDYWLEEVLYEHEFHKARCSNSNKCRTSLLYTWEELMGNSLVPLENK